MASQTVPGADAGATPGAAAAASLALARPSAGCESADAGTAGATTQSITVAGAGRTYRRFIPASGNAGVTPRPVVIDLHGLTSNIDQEVAVSAFETLAQQEDFIVLTPQAAGTPTRWDTSNNAGNHDVAFIASMLDAVEANVCIDAARVYSAGISDGGIMSALLSCRMGDRIVAVGLVSGITHPDGCQPPRPVPMIIFWGKRDRVCRTAAAWETL